MTDEENNKVIIRKIKWNLASFFSDSEQQRIMGGCCLEFQFVFFNFEQEVKILQTETTTLQQTPNTHCVLKDLRF